MSTFFCAHDVLFFIDFSSSPSSVRSVYRDRFAYSHQCSRFLNRTVAIGIKNLIEIRKKDKSPSRQVAQDKKNKSSLSFLAVAAVTFSNGGDNIGVYIPLFSKYNTVSQIVGFTIVFLAMTAVWSRLRNISGVSFCLLSSLGQEYTF